jgi:hypothetical protein
MYVLSTVLSINFKNTIVVFSGAKRGTVLVVLCVRLSVTQKCKPCNFASVCKDNLKVVASLSSTISQIQSCFSLPGVLDEVQRNNLSIRRPVTFLYEDSNYKAAFGVDGVGLALRFTNKFCYWSKRPLTFLFATAQFYRVQLDTTSLIHFIRIAPFTNMGGELGLGF